MHPFVRVYLIDYKIAQFAINKLSGTGLIKTRFLCPTIGLYSTFRSAPWLE
jgi:hypothetical protein